MRYGHLAMSIFCAWVLWAHHTEILGTKVETKWDVDAGYPEKAYSQCTDDALRTVKGIAEGWKDSPNMKSIAMGQLNGGKQSVSIETKGGLLEIWEYVCLPATVDPRAPKGK